MNERMTWNNAEEKKVEDLDTTINESAKHRYKSNHEGKHINNH